MNVRIVLTEPFIRHPAGLVFELDEATGIQGWEANEMLQERINYSGKRTYHLPDGGNGTAYDLLLSATAPCPPEVFENEDLRCGPCRLTRAAFQRDEAPNEVWNPGFKLFEINGLNAQGFEFPLETFETQPAGIELFDALRQIVVRPLPPGNSVDCSDLLPGFYQLRLHFLQGDPYFIHFIKSFPLLVLFMQRHGSYTVQKTLY